MEDLDGIRENSSWSGVHSWHFHQLQQFITYKAERVGIRDTRKKNAYHTSQQCSACGSLGTRDGDQNRGAERSWTPRRFGRLRRMKAQRGL